jgi:LSD1 subclass zinc finger protein
MAAQLMCPNIRCKKVLSVPEDARGKVVRCSHCQTAFRVPVPRQIVPDEPKKKSA